MTLQIESMSVEEVLERQAILNREKKILQSRTNLAADPSPLAQEWMELAGKYALIDSRANMTYCMDRYRSLAGKKIESVDPPPVILFEREEEKSFIPEPELPDEIFDWQNRADMGD